MISRGVVDIFLMEGQLDAARLSRSLDFIAKAGPGTDPTVLGQHHGYVLSHLKPRLSTAQQRAQQAGLDGNELSTRFSNQNNIKQIATAFVQQGKDQKVSPVKSFSAIAAKNLSDHLIALSGEDQQRDTAQVQHAQQTAVQAKRQVAAIV
jgi:hypothetical protein